MNKLIYYQLLLSYLVICEIKHEDNKNETVHQIEKILLSNKFRKIVIIKSIDTNNFLLNKLAKITNYHYFPTISLKIEDVKLFNGIYHDKFSYDAIHEESKIYIILAENMNQFPKILSQTILIYFWRSRDRVIVNFENGTKEEIKTLFELCWKKNIVNIIFIFSEFMYTYNPYFGAYNLMINTTDVFYEKHRDLNGYKIKYSRFFTALDMIIIKNESVGRDAYLASMLASAMNATYEYIPPKDGITYGLKFPNGTMTGVFADVATGFTDMAINSRLVKLQFENLLEATYPHGREDIACLVPKSPKQPEYKKFTILFPKIIWILLLVTMLLYTIIWHLSTASNKREFTKVAFIIFAISLGCPVSDQRGFKLRTILMSYRFYVFLLLSAYSAVLTSVLTVPIQLPEINTLSELEKSRLEIFAATRFKDMFLDNIGSMLTATLVNRITRVPDDPDIDRVIKERGHYAVILKETFALRAILEKDNFKNGIEIYRIMKEKPMPSQVCYALRFGSPALPRINHILRIFQESGLNEYWIQTTVHLLSISKSMGDLEEGTNVEDKLRVVTLDNVSAAYYLLGIGLGVSSIVFIGENIWFKIQKRRDEKKKQRIVKYVKNNE